MLTVCTNDSAPLKQPAAMPGHSVSYKVACASSEDSDQPAHPRNLGLVVQSAVSLTNSLRVISLTVLVDLIHNYSDIFC